MLIYLKHAWEARLARGNTPSREMLLDAIREGAVQRVRPKAMTVCVIIAGLLPIMWSHGTGSEVMQRIAAPGCCSGHKDSVCDEHLLGREAAYIVKSTLSQGFTSWSPL